MHETKYTEILKLKSMLENDHISFTFSSIFDGYQIDSVDGCKDFDVIEHSGSYGSKENLLEIMGLLTIKEKKHDSVKGWLTAEIVFRRIKRARKKFYRCGCQGNGLMMICECSQCANNQTDLCMLATIFPWLTSSDVNGFKRIVDCPYYIERSGIK